MSPLDGELFFNSAYAGWTVEQLQAEADRLAIELLLSETIPKRTLAHRVFSQLTLWMKEILK